LVQLPCLSIPAGWSANGLPIGLQMIAGPGRDTLLLEAAHRFQEELAFRHRWPD
jgi:amidase